MSNMIANLGISIQRSGFDWTDTTWRFVATCGPLYAFAATPEAALADLFVMVAA